MRLKFDVWQNDREKAVEVKEGLFVLLEPGGRRMFRGMLEFIARCWRGRAFPLL